MTTIEEIENAVARLPPDELDAFRAWFAEFDAACFDEKIARDIESGKLDRAEQALANHRNGRTREF
jgi:hypothetical protein